MPEQPCPTIGELTDYVLGRSDQQRREELDDHVEICSACQAQLHTVSDIGDTLLTTLRREVAGPAFEDESDCQNVLQRVAAIGRDPSFSTADHQYDPSQADHPQTIRDYELLEKLGEGGMGAVYKALHTQLEKVVALKILPAARMKDETAVARFKREMKAVGKLEHPNIVGAMDAGEDQGVHYLVMQYVDGIDLSMLTRRVGPLTVADACELVRQAADGLKHAHEHGMVHRDIKPGNLMLTPQGRVKILDLGLALLNENGGQPGAELTSTGQMMGTLDYMAPEQGGSSHEVDIRADVYALGATLYRLLTGQAPFADEHYNTPLKKLMALATEEAPSLRTKRDDSPAELVTIVDKMLAKNPDDRFATPQEVADALGPIAEGADLAALLHRAATEGTESTEDQSAVVTHESLKSGSVETDPTFEVQSNAHAPREKASARVAGAERSEPPAKPSVARRSGGELHSTPATQARRWWVDRRNQVIAAALGGIILLSAIVLYFKTGSGTIVVEIDDPTIQVTVEGEALKITKDQSGDAYKIMPGEKTLHVTRGDLRFDTDKFELRRGEKVVLAVKLVDGQVQVKRVDGQDARIIGRSTLPSDTTKPVTDRSATEWALSIGSSVTLDVNGTEVEVNSAKVLPSGAWKLRSITAPYARQMTDADLKELGGLTHLRGLNTRNNSQVTDVGLKELARLSQLQSLSLWLAKVTDAGLKELAGLKQLQSLNLSGTQVTDAGLKELAGLKNLEKLNLSATQVTDAGLKELAGLKQLRDLGLNGTTVTGTGFKELAGLEELETLNLIAAQVTDAGLKELAGLTQLQALWLNTNPATDEGLKELARLKQLQVLALYNNEVTDALLKELARMTELHVLIFNSPKVTDAGLKELTGMTKLHELRVNCPKVTDAGLIELAKLKQLRALGLNNTQVTDAGLKELAGIKQLQALFLENTRVTDAGLKELAGLKQLKHLDLRDTKVTDAGIAELKKALPGCEILWAAIGSAGTDEAEPDGI